LNYGRELAANLKAQNIRVLLDDRDMRAGDKTWEWIKKGVPLRVEIGGREMDNAEISVTRRDLGKESKQTLAVNSFVEQAQDMLDAIQSNMFAVAKEDMQSRIFEMDNLADARAFFADERQGFVSIDTLYWGTDEFNSICSDFAVTPRCIPLDNQEKMIIGKSY
jgi:prolyl-tRNA synthetase